MSFNSQAYLAYEERRLEPESVLIKGTRKRYHEINKELVLPLDDRTEAEIEKAEIEKAEDEWLRQNGAL